jgi:hypothetical protein
LLQASSRMWWSDSSLEKTKRRTLNDLQAE